jgi:diketogulonate reductase-like aldo/keto reductase
MHIPIKTLKTGESIPALGLGTWLMGGDTSPLISSQDTCDIQLIQHAIEAGFRHIDTAELYGGGHTEELIRTAISPFDRSSLFLASKASKGHHSKSLLIQSLDASLQRLGTDYLDLYRSKKPPKP